MFQRTLLSLGLCSLIVGALHAQDSNPAARVARLAFQSVPDSVTLGDSVHLKAVAYDAANAVVDVPVLYFAAGRTLTLDRTSGAGKALAPGSSRVLALIAGSTQRAQDTIVVRYPPLDRIEVTALPERMYAGAVVRVHGRVMDKSGFGRDDLEIRWVSSDASTLMVDSRGDVTALKPGTATVTGTSEGVKVDRRVSVVANPARTVRVTASADSARTGDVVHFTAQVLDASGRPVADFPVTWAIKSAVEDSVIASEAPAQVDQDGVFVASRAGDYTILAVAGNVVGRATIPVGHRYKSARLSAGEGHGAVSQVHSSDLWVWTGADGNDYAITGTWGGDGIAYFWDVTDPASPTKIDSVKVDARTVNDVKVDEKRGICVISREGASNRRNGLVVLDCSDPHHVTTLSTFDDGLFGGVHNVFLWNNHVFAINAGTRFDIISLVDPKAPKRVSTFELDTPGHGIHDVWVVDGIAYTSNWADGVVLIDVGGGNMGGSLEKPVQMTSYSYPIGATHSAFPFKSKSTGKFYVIVGDEEFPYGLNDTEPDEAGGYIHIVDFSTLKEPVEVARYQIPEAGPHNFWVENDTLYVAYYNAGLRVVDISGELKGNLYDQGRELARFQARDKNGYVPNAAMAWGPQPHKGHVFFTDFNSGLWSVKLPEREARQPLTP